MTPPNEPLLWLRNVTVRFGATTALAALTLAVRPGERIALVGASGSGKTTLLSVACGLRRPTSGTVSRPRELRLGLLLQDPVASLNPGWTIEQIVAEPLRDRTVRTTATERQAAVRLALAEVGLGTLEPDRRPAELSIGQCQRVALARALVAQPHLLLADEPTSALDPSVGAGIARLLDSALTATGAALLVVSHDLFAIAPLVERVLVLHEGRVVESGSPTELLERPVHPGTRRLIETAYQMVIGPSA